MRTSIEMLSLHVHPSRTRQEHYQCRVMLKLEFQHESTDGVKSNSPSPYTPPVYGRKQQMTKLDETNPINKKETKILQKVCGKFLYYARAIDTTMLHALNELATQTIKGTEKTMQALTHFLNYCASHPDAEIIFRASDMVLHNHSDAAYLVASEAAGSEWICVPILPNVTRWTDGEK
jgi:hypothetical protein